MAIKAVGRAAQTVIQDVHEQFRENPGIMEGTSQPDYGRCVRIVTGAALKEMVLPGLLVVAMPLCIGLIFRHFGKEFNTDHDHGRAHAARGGDESERGGVGGGAADGGHDHRHHAGHDDEQRRRRVGQRQEAD